MEGNIEKSIQGQEEVIRETAETVAEVVSPETAGTADVAEVLPRTASSDPFVMTLEDFSDPVRMQSKVAEQVAQLADERANRSASMELELLNEAAIENRAELFGEIDGRELVTHETNMVGETLASAVSEGKVEGLTAESLNDHQSMESFWDTSLGRKIGNYAKAAILATAMIAPMKAVKADTGQIISEGVNQAIVVETQRMYSGTAMEQQLRARHTQLEMELKVARSNFEGSIKLELANMNARNMTELNNFDAQVKMQMARWGADANMTEARKQQQMIEWNAQREAITIRQKTDYETWKVSIDARRGQIELAEQARREQFKAEVESLRAQHSAATSAQRTQVQVTVGARLLQEALRRR